MLLMFLSAMDVLAGVSIIYPSLPIFGSLFYFYLALFHLAKGGWSVLTAAGSGFYFDIPGIIDVLSGFVMFIMYSEISFSFFWVVGAVLLLKGVWSSFFSLS